LEGIQVQGVVGGVDDRVFLMMGAGGMVKGLDLVRVPQAVEGEVGDFSEV
jgi:hypothetical protein